MKSQPEPVRNRRENVEGMPENITPVKIKQPYIKPELHHLGVVGRTDGKSINFVEGTTNPSSILTGPS